VCSQPASCDAVTPSGPALVRPREDPGAGRRGHVLATTLTVFASLPAYESLLA